MTEFRYLNLNPYKRRTGDCVIRAIACALDITWEEASDSLYHIAREDGCEMSCIDCYSTLFEYMDLEEIDVQGMTVEQVAQQFPDDILLIRLQGHLTCSRYNIVYDIWDCRKEVVDRVWVV